MITIVDFIMISIAVSVLVLAIYSIVKQFLSTSFFLWRKKKRVGSILFLLIALFIIIMFFDFINILANKNRTFPWMDENKKIQCKNIIERIIV